MRNINVGLREIHIKTVVEAAKRERQTDREKDKGLVRSATGCLQQMNV